MNTINNSNSPAGMDYKYPVICVCCPRCYNETLTVQIEEGGKGETDFGTAYWYRGQGKCSHCGLEGQHEDQSI